MARCLPIAGPRRAYELAASWQVRGKKLRDAR
jgi:hypothetical protein